MALSPNYGWAEPDNSSLVKNGAQDIRALGDAIDTSVWNVGYGQAGKNKIINGDYLINQRAFTSNTTTGTYNFDRWSQTSNGGTYTTTPQTFTPGAAPIAPYEGRTYLQVVSAGMSASSEFGLIRQRIEDVTTCAGQTVTVSFFAKANTGTPKIGVELLQNFGTGGSPTSSVSTPAGAVTVSSSWARYSVTVAVPSLTGITLGTTANTSSLELNLWTTAGSTLNTRASSIGIQNWTASIWGVQLEYGSKATPFQLAGGGSPQAELAACQRYYIRYGSPNGVAYTAFDAKGASASTNIVEMQVTFPVEMRVKPTALETSAASTFQVKPSSITSLTAVTLDSPTTSKQGAFYVTKTGAFTSEKFYFLIANNDTTAFMGWSAEL
jgi:hypothetical protein